MVVRAHLQQQLDAETGGETVRDMNSTQTAQELSYRPLNAAAAAAAAAVVVVAAVAQDIDAF